MATQWNKYEATAARKHGKPGREVRPKSTTIDIHSHVAIPQAAGYVKPHLDMSTIALAHFATPETKALSQKQEEDIRARITSYDERLADLDAMGIDLQLVMPPPNQCFYTVPLDISVQASRTDDAYAVVATMGENDEDCIAAALAARCGYVAVVASRTRFAEIRESLLARGIAAAAIDQVHSPAGLDLGARVPEEVALSILAEIVQIRRATERARPAPVETEPTEIDPVCGMTVVMATARHKTTHAGHEYFFCNPRCR